MSVASASRVVLRSRPHYLRSLADGVVSYRSLAREILPEVEERVGEPVEEEAVVSALRRIEDVASTDESVLKRSRATLRRGVGVITVEAGLTVAGDIVKTAKTVSNPELLRIVQGERKTTIVAHQDDLDSVARALDRPALFKERGLAEIVVTSPKEIEHEHGIIAEMTSRLSVRGINILEMMSCNTDTIFVVSEEDAEEAVEALTF